MIFRYFPKNYGFGHNLVTRMENKNQQLFTKNYTKGIFGIV